MQAIRWRRAGLAAGAAFAAAAAWRAYQRRHPVGAERAGGADDLASGLAQSVGIGDIDPEPIAQVAGEGIDPDASTRPPPRLDDVVGAAVRDVSTPRR